MSNDTPRSPENEPAASTGEAPVFDEVAESAEQNGTTPPAPPAPEDTYTGEVDVPAEPRSASGHVNTGQGAAVDDETGGGAAAQSEPERVEAAGETGNEHPVTDVYAEPATPAWAPEPSAQAAAELDTPAEPATRSAETGAVPAAPPADTVAAPAGPIYVSTPTPPRNKGNRAAGILISILAGIVFAIVDALVVLGIFAITNQSDILDRLVHYMGTPAYWATAIIFTLALFLLAAIANRGGWWWYVIGGFFVGVIVYFAFVAATLLTNAWEISPGQVESFVSRLWANPLTFAAAIVAREVTVWFGAWIAARGRRVRARNIEAREAYDRELSNAPQLHPAAPQQ
ncbi:hypothetical protein OSC27_13020 [Microbacterium sp. STN6]|uniref:hypothetical protein n=1 Tax=Microbacterium sp. STN6 TaxID=2995588 RepID=UPI00226089F2|nr:hypothetical protein [Microbacterium sp. STN6]MCX7523193.1 hypothetical protein [Microbacterium sp. STN6]